MSVTSLIFKLPPLTAVEAQHIMELIEKEQTPTSTATNPLLETSRKKPTNSKSYRSKKIISPSLVFYLATSNKSKTFDKKRCYVRCTSEVVKDYVKNVYGLLGPNVTMQQLVHAAVNQKGVLIAKVCHPG
ncbi:hypothetical protein NQZ79_g4597 [Umbelopsis isabellina]|nr:hypothetical protein NQZ79_g4597 [Umbelopsis isabellina]